MMPSSSKTKILCLHGLNEDAKIMKRKLSSTLEMLSSEEYEFVFISAPYLLPKIDSILTSHGERKLRTSDEEEAQSKQEKIQALREASLTLSYNRALQCLSFAQGHRDKPVKLPGIKALEQKYYPLMQKLDPDAKSEVQARLFDLHGAGKRWWTIPNEMKGSGFYIGHEASFEVISKAMHDYGPFDAVIGFSTGAMMASLCQILLQDSYLFSQEPTFQPPPTQKPFKFAIYFAPWLAITGPYAAMVRNLQHQTFNHIPSLCFQGVRDKFCREGKKMNTMVIGLGWLIFFFFFFLSLYIRFLL